LQSADSTLTGLDQAATTVANELLLCCASVLPDDTRAEKVRQLVARPLDWDDLIRAARIHGVVPLVSAALSSSGALGVPEDVSEQLRKENLRNVHRNLYLTSELLRILDRFTESGISAVPFKGPSLAVSVYGHLALRQFTDLDILVRERDVSRARDLLIEQGYRAQQTLTDQQLEGLLRLDNELMFEREADLSMVDLQWRFRPEYFSFPLDMNRLWERMRALSLGGKEILTLAPEDLLLILCVHGTKHAWVRLAWVCDVARLVDASPLLDWDECLKQARALGAERMLFLGLFLAAGMLAAPLPAPVLEQVRNDPAVRSLAAIVRRHLFSPANAPMAMFASSLFHLRARERWRDRARYCFGLGISPTARDVAYMSLPPALTPLYYLLRPVRLAAVYGAKLLRRPP
jgi:hypothetical protein